ncbi:MAG: hypothetical protein JO108_21945 [Acidobacteriaceae bacterium]|nr:hypothetical protein [Acidobacteriaceae bacterium]
MNSVTTSRISKIFTASILAVTFLRPPGLLGQLSCNSITQQTSIGTAWDCTFPPFCIADYDSFPDRAATYRQPITELQLALQIWDIATGQVGQQNPKDLPGAILNGLNIRFLVDGLGTRNTRVTTISDAVYVDATGSPYRQRELLFTDAYVGTFKGILLTPPTQVGVPANYPVVLALHGHGDTAETYRDTYFGTEYPKNGLGILILTLRAMDPWLGEHIPWEQLIRNGFNLMGMRVYEALIGLKYLSCNPEVKRLGLIGHSGGSSTGNLVVRVTPYPVAAYVSDYQIDYAKLDAPEPYHCETIPRIYPYHVAINNFATVQGVPIYSVPYGYTGVSQNILDFFAKNLNH